MTYEIITIEEAKEINSKRRRNKFLKLTTASVLTLSIFGGVFAGGYGAGQSNAIKQFKEIAATYETNASDATSKVTSLATTSDKNIGVNSVVPIVKEVADSVVSINVVSSTKNRFNQIFSSQQAGSGIIFSQDSEKIYIVTNNHVIENGTTVTISVDDDKEAKAEYVGSDPQADLAVIAVTKTALAEAGIDSYKIAQFGDSDSLEVGEPVVAIGNAAGEGKSATYGIISAKNKTISVDSYAMNMLQTDAAINPGNSGGALVDFSGKVIGVNTAKLAAGGIEGMGYSIPINEASIIIDRLMKGGDKTVNDRPYLGIQGMDITEEIKEYYSIVSTGVYVSEVYENSGAADAGLRATDLIIGFNNSKIRNMEDLSAALTASKIGDKIKLYIYRDNATQLVLDVTLKKLNDKF